MYLMSSVPSLSRMLHTGKYGCYYPRITLLKGCCGEETTLPSLSPSVSNKYVSSRQESDVAGNTPHP